MEHINRYICHRDFLQLIRRHQEVIDIYQGRVAYLERPRIAVQPRMSVIGEGHDLDRKERSQFEAFSQDVLPVISRSMNDKLEFTRLPDLIVEFYRKIQSNHGQNTIKMLGRDCPAVWKIASTNDPLATVVLKNAAA